MFRLLLLFSLFLPALSSYSCTYNTNDETDGSRNVSFAFLNDEGDVWVATPNGHVARINSSCSTGALDKATTAVTSYRDEQNYIILSSENSNGTLTVVFDLSENDTISTIDSFNTGTPFASFLAASDGDLIYGYTHVSSFVVPPLPVDTPCEIYPDSYECHEDDGYVILKYAWRPGDKPGNVIPDTSNITGEINSTDSCIERCNNTETCIGFNFWQAPFENMTSTCTLFSIAPAVQSFPEENGIWYTAVKATKHSIVSINNGSEIITPVLYYTQPGIDYVAVAFVSGSTCTYYGGSSSEFLSSVTGTSLPSPPPAMHALGTSLGPNCPQPGIGMDGSNVRVAVPTHAHGILTNSRVTLYDASGTELKTFATTSSIVAAGLSPPMMVTALSNGDVQFWNTSATGPDGIVPWVTNTTTFRDACPFVALQVSPNGSTVVFGTKCGIVTAWYDTPLRIPATPPTVPPCPSKAASRQSNIEHREFVEFSYDGVSNSLCVSWIQSPLKMFELRKAYAAIMAGAGMDCAEFADITARCDATLKIYVAQNVLRSTFAADIASADAVDLLDLTFQGETYELSSWSQDAQLEAPEKKEKWTKTLITTVSVLGAIGLLVLVAVALGIVNAVLNKRKAKEKEKLKKDVKDLIQLEEHYRPLRRAGRYIEREAKKGIRDVERGAKDVENEVKKGWRWLKREV